MRDRLRMAQDAPLQLILFHWSKGILRSDLAMQEPGTPRVLAVLIARHSDRDRNRSHLL
jgi:hypothetical protein